MHPITLGAALALLPLGLAPAAAQIAPPMQPMLDGTLLEVVAEGRTTRVPDVATIRAGVVTQAATAALAMRDNAARMNAVLVALKRAGVAERDLRTSTIGLQPQYRYAEGRPPVVTGYQATNSVEVRFRDVARSGAILDALVASGANQIEGPDLSVDRPDAALDEARTDAVTRARARATLYAQASGLSVGRILSITETAQDAGGPGRPPVLYARAEAAAQSSQIVPGERDISVTITVRFLLK